MSLAKCWVGGLLCCVAGLAGSVLATDAPGGNGSPPPNKPVPAQTIVAGFGQAVSASTLDHYSGGASMQATANLSGTVSGNSASQLATGANSIAGDAFSGASGLPSVIQNSGNNVLIQNGVVVNVQMKP